MEEINLLELQEELAYNPITGEFMWVKPKQGRKLFTKIGCPDDKGYLQIVYNGKPIRAHKLAFVCMLGKLPKIVDHINGDITDNRWNNLRECTAIQNAQNTKIPSSNKSGIKGVYWHKAARKWCAEFRHNGNKIYLGLFNSLKDATQTIKTKRKELFKEFERE